MKIKEKYEGVSYDARSNFGAKGWWIIILCALTMLTFTSVATLSMNVVVQGKADELGIAYATLVGWNTPAGIIGLFATLGLSQLATKLKLKIVHVASLLLGAVACIFWGLSSSLPGYVIPLIFMFCFMSSTECVSGKMIANWFPKKKGIATGWATMGLNAAGLFMVALLTGIYMSTGSIRNCMFFLAALLVFLSILTIFFYKDRPEEWNAYPDNDPHAEPEPEIRTGWTVGKGLKQKETWFISIAVGLIAMTTFGLMATLVPSSLMKGVPIEQALLMMTVAGIVGFLGSYFFGWVDQKFGVKLSTVVLCIWLIVSCLLFYLPGVPGQWIFVILMSMTIGATNNYPISMTAQVFGRSGFQVAYGVIYLIKGVFQYLYGILFTISLTSTGGYGLAWIIMAVCSAIALVFFLFVNLKPKTDPIELENIAAKAEA